MVKRDDVLRLAVFEHGERAAIQIGDDVLLVVDHRGMQQNFVHVFLEDEDSLLVQILVLIVFLAALAVPLGRVDG